MNKIEIAVQFSIERKHMKTYSRGILAGKDQTKMSNNWYQFTRIHYNELHKNKHGFFK